MLSYSFLFGAGERSRTGPGQVHGGALLVSIWLVLWISDAVGGPWWRGLAISFLVTVVLIAFFRKWMLHATRLRKELAPPVVAPDKLLIVRSPADEASGILITGQFISQL